MFPTLERRDLWNVSVDGSPYTVVRAYPNFDPNPGNPGRHVYNKTHAQALLLKEMFEVGFELVSSTMPNMGGATYLVLSYRGKRSIYYTAQRKPYNTSLLRMSFFLFLFSFSRQIFGVLFWGDIWVLPGKS